MLRSLWFGLLVGLLVLGVIPLFSAPPAPVKVPKKLLEKQRDAAKKSYEAAFQRIKTSGGAKETIEEILQRDENNEKVLTVLPERSCRWLKAQLALCEGKPDRRAAYHAHLARVKKVKAVARAMEKKGEINASCGDAAAFYRLEAVIWLIEAGGKAAKEDMRVPDFEGVPGTGESLPEPKRP